MQQRPFLLALLLLTCACANPHDTHASSSLAAARLLTGPPDGAQQARTLTVRFYVDPAYAEEILNPHERLTQIVERANDTLLPTLGVRLRVLDLRTWDRQAPRDDMDAMLAELIQLDPAQEADWVVGVAPVNGTWSNTHHQLGLAHLLSPHFILRNTADSEEEAYLKSQHPQADPDLLSDLLLERRKHKETVVFLHEWAHTLGALHTPQSRAILAPLYSPQTQAFTPANVALLHAALKHLDQLRGARTSEDAAAHLLRTLNQLPAQDFLEQDRIDLLDLLQHAITQPRTLLPDDAIPPYNQAVERLNAEAPRDALDLLASPLERYPDNPTLLLLAAQASSHLQRDDDTLRYAQRALQHLTDSPRPSADTLTSLQHLFERLGALTPLEQLAARLDPAAGQPILDRALAVRQHLGVPPDLLEPALEAQAVRYLRASLQPRAEPPPRPPGLPDTLPGLHLLDCAQRRAPKPKEAYKACLRAVERWDQTWLASFYLGSLDLQQKRYPQAEQHLKRVLRVHPAEPAAWRNLAIALKALKKNDEYKALDLDYQARFKRGPLP